MKRRNLIVAGTAPLIARPFDLLAQAQARRPIVACLGTGTKVTAAVFWNSFAQGMTERAWIDGRNYDLVVRYADGSVDRLVQIASDYAKLPAAVIVTANTIGVEVAFKATSTIPIVTAATGTPVELGVAYSEARPGKNVTGVLSSVPGFTGKLVQFAKELVPELKQIGYLRDLSNPNSPRSLPAVVDAARQYGMEVLEAGVERSSDEVVDALEKLSGVRAVIVTQSPLFLTERKHIADFFASHRIAAVYQFREHVVDGGLLSYGISLDASFRRCAYFVDRILKGEKAGDLPFEFPTTFDLVINAKAAKDLGLTIPDTISILATEIIE